VCYETITDSNRKNWKCFAKPIQVISKAKEAEGKSQKNYQDPEKASAEIAEYRVIEGESSVSER